MSSSASSSSESDPQQAVLSTIAEERESLLGTSDVEAQEMAKQKVSWKNLPHKSQLAILCLARLADSFAIYSTQVYLFNQVKSFNPDATDTEISTQAGFLVASKTVLQILTGVFWGKVADSQNFGRRTVLTIGLFCSGVSCIGYGISQNLLAAAVCKMLGGAMSNNVGITKTVVGDLYPEEGTTHWRILGRAERKGFFQAYPFLLPNIVAAALYAVAAVVVFLGLEETLPGHSDSDGCLARRVWNKLTTPVIAYAPVDAEAFNSPGSSTLNDPEPSANAPQDARSQDNSDGRRLDEDRKLSFWAIWTSKVLLTLLAQFMIAGHISTFTNLWAVFLSTPVAETKNQRPPIWFNGGLGMKSHDVGLAMSSLGAVAVLLQVIVFPRLNARFTKLRIWRWALWFFPVAYLLAPYPALFGTSEFEVSENLGGKKALLCLSMSSVLLLFVAGKIATTPAMALLINDCTPYSSVRGRINCAGTAAGSMGRTAVPILIFAVFGEGLDIGVVGEGFWFLALFALLACLESQWVNEGAREEEIVPEGEESYIQGQQDRCLGRETEAEVVTPSPKSSRNAPFAPETPLRRHQVRTDSKRPNVIRRGRLYPP